MTLLLFCLFNVFNCKIYKALIKPNPSTSQVFGASSSFLRAAELLDVIGQTQAMHDPLLLSSQLLCRHLAQEFLNK